MRYVIATLSMLLTSMPLAVHAGDNAADNPVVIELFTSQGCSSCPPADRLLQDLGNRDDVIALALHVDYWDYLGWIDDYAHTAFTNRQKAYANAGHRRTVFTPELVVQGTDSVVGHKQDLIQKAISAHQQRPPQARISMERNGTVLSVVITPLATDIAAADVLLVRYRPDAEVMIERGENAGKTVFYTNIVDSIARIATWDGKSEISLRIEQVTGAVAVIAQQKDYGPVLTAARLD